MITKRPYEAFIDVVYTFRVVVNAASSPEDAEEQAEALFDSGEDSGELVEQEVVGVAASPLHVDEQLSLPFPEEEEIQDERGAVEFEDMDGDEEECE